MNDRPYRRRPFKKKKTRTLEAITLRLPWRLSRAVDRLQDRLEEDFGMNLSLSQALCVAVSQGLQVLGVASEKDVEHGMARAREGRECDDA